jgi:protein TonB
VTACQNPDPRGKYHIGCGVTPPVVLYQPEPDYPKEASARKLLPNGLVFALTVDADGHPVNVHIKRSRVGEVAEVDRPAERMLEEKMVEAVTHYRFKPATFQGKGVPVEMNVEIEINPF